MVLCKGRTKGAEDRALWDVTRKKKGAKECVEFRTISLVTHASKIVLKMIARRLKGKAEAFLGDDQFGFRKERGTRDAIAALRVLAGPD